MGSVIGGVIHFSLGNRKSSRRFCDASSASLRRAPPPPHTSTTTTHVFPSTTMGVFFSSSRRTWYTEPAKVRTRLFDAFEAGLPSMRGKHVAITGTTTGTGRVAAMTCAKKGAARIFLLNRPSERAVEARASIAAAAPPGCEVIHVDCDLTRLDDVRAAAAVVAAAVADTGLDVLCNNAGVMALADTPTVDGFDVQMQTNHLSHFLLVRELMPALERAAERRGDARVVHHTSGARMGVSRIEPEYLGPNGGRLGGDGASMWLLGARWRRYAQTKLANAAFTAELDARLRRRKSEVKALVASPGLAATNLQVSTHADGGMSEVWLMKYLAQSAEDGTMPLLTCMAAPGVSGGELYEPLVITGAARRKKLEKSCVDETNRKTLWEMSEKAVGATFHL